MSQTVLLLSEVSRREVVYVPHRPSPSVVSLLEDVYRPFSFCSVLREMVYVPNRPSPFHSVAARWKEVYVPNRPFPFHSVAAGGGLCP